MVTHTRFQQYDRKHGLVCLTGMLGCRWHRYQQSTENTEKVDVVWFVFLWIVAGFMSIWLYFWLVAKNDMGDVNISLYNHFGSWFSYYNTLLILTCIVFSYVCLLVVLSMCHVGHSHQIYIHKVHKSLLVLICAGCISATVITASFWGHAWELQVLSLKLTGPYLHVGAIVLMLIVTWFIAGQWWLLNSISTKVAWMLVFTTLMVTLYIIPVFIESPCISDIQGLPHQPQLFAYMGAAAVAPENTLKSFQIAANHSLVIGFETHVTVSYDGVPFLLRDDTLKRTTNIDTELPDRQNECACMFNISTIQSLDAGSWYIKRDPYWQVSKLDETEKESYINQTIPTLAQLLELTRIHNLSILLNIREIYPEIHPYRGLFKRRILDVIHESGIDPSKIWWQYEQHNGTENFTKVGTQYSTIEHLVNNSIQHVNLFYPGAHELEEYTKFEIQANVYTVNSVWLYNVYWCMGASTVSTLYSHSLSQIDGPKWLMERESFNMMWMTADCVSAAIIVCIFIVQRFRMIGSINRPESVSLQSAKIKMTHRQKSRNMKEKLIFAAEGLQELEIDGSVSLPPSECNLDIDDYLDPHRFSFSSSADGSVIITNATVDGNNRMSGISHLSGFSASGSVNKGSSVGEGSLNATFNDGDDNVENDNTMCTTVSVSGGGDASLPDSEIKGIKLEEIKSEIGV